MRLKFETLLEVQDYYGSSDFQVEARYENRPFLKFLFGLTFEMIA